AVEGHSAAGSGPGKLRNFDLAAFLLSLGFGEACPGNFGVREYDRWNCVRFKRDFVSSNVFDCCASLVRCLVRQHWLPDNIADGIDRRIISLQMLVYLDKPALSQADLG